MSLLTSACALILAVMAPTSAATLPREARPGDVFLSVVSLLPQDGTISAHEPLVAHIKLTNLTTEELKFLHYSMRLEVYDSNGRLVGATPRWPLPGDLLVGVLRIPAGGSLTRWVVLSALYQFRKPGDYTVRVQQLIPSEGLPVLAEAATQVRVLPFDGPRLRARCEEIFAPWRSFGRTRARIPRNPSAFPMRTRLQAIYSIRHDAVLPYLSLIAREWVGTSENWPATVSIRRIGSKRSEELFSTLTARRDKVGKVARMVAKERLGEVDDWYVGDEWQSENSSRD